MEEKYKYIPIQCDIVFFESDAIRTSGDWGGDEPYQDGNDYGFNDVYGD